MNKLKNLWFDTLFWEVVGYITLALCVVGQIAVGYIYIPAQIAYLVANLLSVVRDFALHLPRSNKVKDICFTGITAGLIIIYLIRG